MVDRLILGRHPVDNAWAFRVSRPGQDVKANLPRNQFLFREDAFLNGAVQRGSVGIHNYQAGVTVAIPDRGYIPLCHMENSQDGDGTVWVSGSRVIQTTTFFGIRVSPSRTSLYFHWAEWNGGNGQQYTWYVHYSLVPQLGV